jgi:hypothetical protein
MYMGLASLLGWGGDIGNVHEQERTDFCVVSNPKKTKQSDKWDTCRRIIVTKRSNSTPLLSGTHKKKWVPDYSYKRMIDTFALSHLLRVNCFSLSLFVSGMYDHGQQLIATTHLAACSAYACRRKGGGK